MVQSGCVGVRGTEKEATKTPPVGRVRPLLVFPKAYKTLDTCTALSCAFPSPRSLADVRECMHGHEQDGPVAPTLAAT